MTEPQGLIFCDWCNRDIDGAVEREIGPERDVLTFHPICAEVREDWRAEYHAETGSWAMAQEEEVR